MEKLCFLAFDLENYIKAKIHFQYVCHVPKTESTMSIICQSQTKSKSTMSIIRQSKGPNESTNGSCLSYHLKIWEYNLSWKIRGDSGFLVETLFKRTALYIGKFSFSILTKCILRRNCFCSSFFGSYFLGSSVTEDLSSALPDTTWMVSIYTPLLYRIMKTVGHCEGLTHWWKDFFVSHSSCFGGVIECLFWTEYWHCMFSTQLCGLVYHAQFVLQWQWCVKTDRKRLRRKPKVSSLDKSTFRCQIYQRERGKERKLCSTIKLPLHVQN